MLPWYSALVYNTLELMINYSFFIFVFKFKQVLLYSILLSFSVSRQKPDASFKAVKMAAKCQAC